MLIKNNIYKLEIMNQDSEGRGIGRYEEIVIFVDGALPGDIVKAEITKVKKKYSFAKIVEIIIPSKLRILPSCEIYYRCGGCNLQHESYEGQLSFKEKRVKETLERIGNVKNILINPIVRMDNPEHYRNKGVFQSGEEDGKLIFGFYENKSHKVVKVNNCLIQHKDVTGIIETVENFCNENNITPFNRKTKKGIVKHLFIRIGNKSNEIMIGVIINGSKLHNQDILIEQLTAHNDNIKSIMININKDDNNNIFGKQTYKLFGEKFITDVIGDIKFKISLESFYQVNSIQTEKLYSEILECANLTNNEIVIDAYSGVGTISLFLAKKSKKVFGLELLEKAVFNANANKKLNNIDNVDFILGAVEENIEKVCKNNSIDAIILDPPRNGCDPLLLSVIAENNINTIVYASCNPGTLARDIKILVELGYIIDTVRPVDMFGHTSHVECVVGLHKN